MKTVKIVVEKHPDGYVAYPLGLKGTVVGEGDTYEEALADCESAVRLHVETFGPEVLDVESLTLPNHPHLKGSTLRTICTQSGIAREDFLRAYDRV